jgi:GDP-D-mannose dehydratase
LIIGNLVNRRVEAMYLMLQQEESDDYVIATGESYQLAEFIEIAFRLVGLDWREYVVSDKGLCRPTDIVVSRGNPTKAILVPRHWQTRPYRQQYQYRVAMS